MWYAFFCVKDVKSSLKISQNCTIAFLITKRFTNYQWSRRPIIKVWFRLTEIKMSLIGDINQWFVYRT